MVFVKIFKGFLPCENNEQTGWKQENGWTISYDDS